MRGCVARSVLLFAVVWPAAAFAQRSHDPLSEAQADQIRELGNRPNERLKLLLGFVNEQVAAIREMTPNSGENDRPVELRKRYEEFTELADELSDNVDTYDADRADIRKALKVLAEGSRKWAAVLEGPSANATYDFARKVALDSAQASVEQADKLLAREQSYFAAHKSEAGKNGKAPSPDR